MFTNVSILKIQCRFYKINGILDYAKRKRLLLSHRFEPLLYGTTTNTSDGNTATCCMGVYGVKTVRFKPQKLFISYI